jgi:hypothetical protein
MSFNKPASDDWQSVENYIYNNKQVEERETRFIYHKEDLVTLRPGREHAWLDSSVEKMLKWFNCWLIEVSPSSCSHRFPNSPALTASSIVDLLLQSKFPITARHEPSPLTTPTPGKQTEARGRRSILRPPPNRTLCRGHHHLRDPLTSRHPHLSALRDHIESHRYGQGKHGLHGHFARVHAAVFCCHLDIHQGETT